jgi:hypothetical protein
MDAVPRKKETRLHSQMMNKLILVPALALAVLGLAGCQSANKSPADAPTASLVTGWEYTSYTNYSRDEDEPMKTINKLGTKSWELCSTVVSKNGVGTEGRGGSPNIHHLLLQTAQTGGSIQVNQPGAALRPVFCFRSAGLQTCLRTRCGESRFSLRSRRSGDLRYEERHRRRFADFAFSCSDSSAWCG